LNRWVDICCTTPARLLNLAQKGSITVGNDADLVVFDPNAEVILSYNWLHENVDWTPYEGLAIRGWPAVTISRGRVLVENGEFRGAAGHGRFLKRALS
jgi:dihydropyrimidinase